MFNNSKNRVDNFKINVYNIKIFVYQVVNIVKIKSR